MPIRTARTGRRFGACAHSRTAARSAGRPGLFGAVTVVPALLAAAWLLPGLSRCCSRAGSRPRRWRPCSPRWPWACATSRCASSPRAGPASAALSKPVPWRAVAATVAVAVGFAAWQIAERTQQVIVLRDPAAYLQTAYWIAHHGSLPIPHEADAFGGAYPGLTFASAGYSTVGSGLVPQFMTGLPLVLAAGVWLGGVPAALVVTPLIGACAVLSFGGLAGAGRGPLGARRGRGPGAEPARAVHQPRHIRRAAGPGAAVRRPVPAGRFPGDRPPAGSRGRPARPGPRAGRAGRPGARPHQPDPHRRAERHPARPSRSSA